MDCGLDDSADMKRVDVYCVIVDFGHAIKRAFDRICHGSLGVRRNGFYLQMNPKIGAFLSDRFV
jgi:hypothetical protein